MHQKKDVCVPIFPPDDLNALAARIKEVVETSPESLAKVEEVHISLTRLDVTIIPKR